MISIKKLKNSEEPPVFHRIEVIDEEELEMASEQEKARMAKRAVKPADPPPVSAEPEPFSSKLGRQVSGQNPVTASAAPDTASSDIDLSPDDDETEEANQDQTGLIQKNKVTMAPPISAYRPRLKMYRKFALIFLFLVLLLSGVVFYLIFVKMTVVITPAQELISNNIIFDVVNGETADMPEKVSGKVEIVEIEDALTIQSTGEKVLSEEVGGMVTIVNNYTNQQQLVASTRLLTPDQKLFRLKNTVLVPAGGSVEAQIYADKPGADMSIGPSKFTIPGLWAGLQDKIFAESAESMKNVRNVKKHITSDDIIKAETEIKAAIIKKAESLIQEEYKDQGEILFKLDEATLTSKVMGRIDEEKDSFSVSGSALANVVLFKKENAIKAISEKFLNSIPQEKELITFNENEIKFSLNDFNSSEKTAAVNASFDGKMALKDGTTAVDPKTLAGLNQAQIEDYLKRQKDIASYEIIFSPSFIKTAPRLVDRIKVEVKK